MILTKVFRNSSPRITYVYKYGNMRHITEIIPVQNKDPLLDIYEKVHTCKRKRQYSKRAKHCKIQQAF
jgi:hypothetical protein